MKKIQVLGMRIEDYTTRESHMLLENYLNDATFHVIETLTMERLFGVTEDVLVKETMEESDLLIVGQPEILKETGVVTPQRLREVREKDFFKEFFHCMVQNDKKVFLLGWTVRDLEHFWEYVSANVEEWRPVASYALSECVGDTATVVNEMNSSMAQVIVSCLPMKEEAQFLSSHKGKISASVWYGVDKTYAEPNQGLFRMISGMMQQKKLHNEMIKLKLN